MNNCIAVAVPWTYICGRADRGHSPPLPSDPCPWSLSNADARNADCCIVPNSPLSFQRRRAVHPNPQNKQLSCSKYVLS